MESNAMGAFIAALRKTAGLTQKELADKLHVSDKSISRWERGEGAPDLSLIPVIAELFGVTSDELLRGRRQNVPSSEQEEPSLSPKLRQRVLAASFSRYKSRSAIAAGLSGCGLLAALTGNLAFLRAYLGFFAGAVFFLAAVITQFVCLNSAFLAVSGEEFQQPQVDDYRYRCVLWAEGILGLTAVLFAFTLPLVLLTGDAYLGLSGDSLMAYGLPFSLAAVIFWCCVVWLVNHQLMRNGRLRPCNPEQARYRSALKGWCAAGLAVLLTVTGFVHQGLKGFGDPTLISEKIVFEDFDSFKEFMEQDIPWDPSDTAADQAVPPAPVGPVQYYDESGNPITEEEALTETITDSEGNILCTFLRRNQSVWSWKYGHLDGEILPITVYTQQHLEQARRRMALMDQVFGPIYCLETVGAVFVYFRLRQKKRTKV